MAIENQNSPLENHTSWWLSRCQYVSMLVSNEERENNSVFGGIRYIVVGKKKSP